MNGELTYRQERPDGFDLGALIFDRFDVDGAAVFEFAIELLLCLLDAL